MPIAVRQFILGVVVLEIGDHADGVAERTGDDDRLAGGQGVALELGARRQAADIAGHRQCHADRGRPGVERATGDRAQRLQ